MGKVTKVNADNKIYLEGTSLFVVPVDEVLAITPVQNRSEVESILYQSNFKTLFYQGFLSQDNIPFRILSQNNLEAFWVKAEDVYQKASTRISPDEALVISYRLNKSGKISHLVTPLRFKEEELNTLFTDALKSIEFVPLPDEYTAEWLPQMIIVSKKTIQSNALTTKFNQSIRSLSVASLLSRQNESCIFRLRGVLNLKNGEVIYSKNFANLTKTGARSKKHKQCKGNLDKESIFSSIKATFSDEQQAEIFGFSLWFFPAKNTWVTSLFSDDLFIQNSQKTLAHDYIYRSMEPALEKEMVKTIKKEKIKLNWKHTRQGRYLITFSKDSWPLLKSVKLTTPSGDSRFDNLCSKTLETFELPPLPKLLSVEDYETVYVCALWN